MNWVAFDQEHGPNQPLPPLRRCVLVMLPARDGQGMGLPVTVAVGYLKFAAGDETCPYFVIPGVGGKPTHWCDSLGDDFEAPAVGWRFPNRQPDRRPARRE